MCHKIFLKLQGLLKAKGQHFHETKFGCKGGKNVGIIPMKAAMLRNTYILHSAPKIYLLKCALYSVTNNIWPTLYTEVTWISTNPITAKNAHGKILLMTPQNRLYYGSIWQKTGIAQNLSAKASILNSSKSCLPVFEPIPGHRRNIQIQYHSFTHATLLNTQNAGCYMVWVE